MTKSESSQNLAEPRVQGKKIPLSLELTRRDFELAATREDKSWLKSLLERWQPPEGSRVQ
jgi:hypothetical protein